MMSQSGNAEIGAVRVITTVGRGASPSEIADRAIDKIISVGETSHPLIRDQALAYKDEIRNILEYYMTEVVKGEHTNVRNRLRNAGCPEIIPVALGE